MKYDLIFFKRSSWNKTKFNFRMIETQHLSFPWATHFWKYRTVLSWYFQTPSLLTFAGTDPQVFHSWAVLISPALCGWVCCLWSTAAKWCCQPSCERAGSWLSHPLGLRSDWRDFLIIPASRSPGVMQDGRAALALLCWVSLCSLQGEKPPREVTQRCCWTLGLAPKAVRDKSNPFLITSLH